MGDAIPALLAGNAVVLKPDAQTPFTALWTAALLAEAGLPAGLLQVVTGRGAELGTPLIDATDFLMFTGSTATGKVVAAQAAAQLKDCSMELGGKNPLLVLPGARLGATVRGAVRGICANSGQLCISIERLYVHTDLYDAFVPRLAAALRDVRLGSAFDFGPDMGSLGERRSARRRSPPTSTTPSARVPMCSPAGGPAPTSVPTSTSPRCWPA